MANSFSTDLILDRISKRTLTYLGNILAPFNAFSTDFSDEPFTQGQNVRFQIANAGATAQKNPTNWESGNSGLANVNAIVDQYSVSFQLTPRQLNNGFKLDQLVDINLQSFGNQIVDVAFAPLTTTNFTNYTLSIANLSQANVANLLATAWVNVAKAADKNAILDAASYAKLLPTQLTTELGPRAGLAGMSAIYPHTRWTGAGANIYGAVMTPGAVGIIAGLPEQVAISGAFEGLEQTTLMVPLGGGGTINQGGVPGPQLRVTMSTWLSLATRTRWMSFDAMMGACASGDSASGVVFKSA